MSAVILDDARKYLIHSLKGKFNSFETKHPWRREWEFTVMHSLHIESYALKILARENHLLAEHEIILLRLAAILHDVARLEKTDQHAKLGAELAKEWLLDRTDSFLTVDHIDRVAELIRDHSNKDVRENDFSKAVLKDADTLDEIGAMSIFMAGNWLDKQSPFFFYELRQRLQEVELPYCDRKRAILNTDGARSILAEKKAFVDNFITQLTDELQADHQIEQMLLGQSPTND